MTLWVGAKLRKCLNKAQSIRYVIGYRAKTGLSHHQEQQPHMKPSQKNTSPAFSFVKAHFPVKLSQKNTSLAFIFVKAPFWLTFSEAQTPAEGPAELLAAHGSLVLKSWIILCCLYRIYFINMNDIQDTPVTWEVEYDSKFSFLHISLNFRLHKNLQFWEGKIIFATFWDQMMTD